MERIQERGLWSLQALGMGNGVHHYDTAQDLALVDAGLATGAFGYEGSEARNAVHYDTLDEARLESLYSEDALAHEQEALSQGRKSKLALLRGEADGSVRGLRNAVISIGHWLDLDHAPEDAAAPSVASYADSWRIGWAERLPQIMQLSVDGPLEEMGLEKNGNVPQREPVSDPLGDGSAALLHETQPEVAQLDAGEQVLSEQGRAFLAGMMSEEDEPEAFIFAAPEPATAFVRGASAHDAQLDLAQQEVMFVESQYAALHGALYDGDRAANWQTDDAEDNDSIFAPHAGSERHAQDGHLHGYEGHFA
ncbi:hypothetical protein [Alloyangia pacifica]|uniref:Uncharacterized protein n=1 Tax=Alloyangia pacifica TaxID=311180 RepID=A0A1I6U4D7_9RHOB|nr:hypothetical protein [Alloyangia pacifica]SDH37880.1 hypothetical protein SAMN04488245_107145 [Alloyangia pacifica]SFS96320.1 hypothetical protein SAMN04488050_107145 [Alloyangia pacifica]